MSEPGFLDNVRSRGTQLRDSLAELKERHPIMRQVRGPGLMVAVAFDEADIVPPLLEHCLRESRVILLRSGSAGNIIRWVPPLVATADEIDESVSAFGAALKALT